MSHKANFIGFIEPNYKHVAEVDHGAIQDAFQAFNKARLAEIPDDAPPADKYMFNAWMGEYARKLAQAKDAFYNAQLAYYAKRGSGAQGSTT